MVAKSYQGWATYGKPFEENKKMYVVVVTPKGAHKKVRFYSEAEYAKMYPEEEVKPKRIRSVKDVLGFSKGYITIFKGDTYPLLEWFQQSPCRFHNFWGWYLVSEDEEPQWPAGITPVRLKWEDVAIVEEDCLKSEALVRQAVDALIYESSPSKFQGQVGDRLELTLTVKKVFEKEGYYGNSALHIFSDEAGNVYTWNTSSKTLEVGRTYRLKGTVKEHTCFRNVNQTILTRCAICQDKTV